MITTSLELQAGIALTNPGDLDPYFGPYAALADAYGTIPIELRQYKRFGLIFGSTLVTYCWSKISAGILQVADGDEEIYGGLLYTAENVANKGIADGYVPLNSSAQIDATYLPSFVDDVVEYANLAAFPMPGESSKIYVADDTGKIYRWSGSAYINISASPGTTDDVSEGVTNLYFTVLRARAVLSATSPIMYDSTTGIISVLTASPTQAGIITAGAQSFAGIKTFTSKAIFDDVDMGGELTMSGAIHANGGMDVDGGVVSTGGAISSSGGFIVPGGTVNDILMANGSTSTFAGYTGYDSRYLRLTGGSLTGALVIADTSGNGYVNFAPNPRASIVQPTAGTNMFSSDQASVINKNVAFKDSSGGVTTFGFVGDNVNRLVQFTSGGTVFMKPAGSATTQYVAGDGSLQAISSIPATLNITEINYAATTAGMYIALGTDDYIKVDASGGAITIGWPHIVGKVYYVKKVDASVNPVTIISPTDQGGTYPLLTQGKFVVAVCDAALIYNVIGSM